MLHRLLLLLAFLAPLPASAQDEVAVDAVEEEEEGTICVAIGRLWVGNNAEIRGIEQVPVPESYRAQFESTEPCTRFWLIEESLVDWHLRFGSEASASAALVYLERGYTRDVPAPEQYRKRVERAWREAQGDLGKARAIVQPEGITYSAQWRFVERSQPIQRFKALLATRETYLWLAREHLDAAEEFGSLALLDTAERYLRAALAGADFLAPAETAQAAPQLIHFNLQSFRTDDLELRAAVLRARLSRTAETIAAAEAALRSKERPFFRELAEHAFIGGDNICDVGDGASNEEALAAACEADDDEYDAVHERVVSYWRSRAALDLLADDEPRSWDSSFSLAMRLLGAEIFHDRGRCCRYRPEDDQLYLHLARAEHHRRLLDVAGGEHGDHNNEGQEALDELQAAELLARPFEAPGRFRRIAQEWLDARRTWQALRKDEEREYIEQPANARYAAYLERMLTDLNAIAQGATE